MDDEDMFLNDDDFDDDTKLSKLDDAKIKAADYMSTNLQLLIDDLQYNERDVAQKHFDIVSQTYAELVELFKLDPKVNDLTDAELKNITDKIKNHTTKMTLENQDEILDSLESEEKNVGGLNSGIMTFGSVVPGVSTAKIDHDEDTNGDSDDDDNRGDFDTPDSTDVDW